MIYQLLVWYLHDLSELQLYWFQLQKSDRGSKWYLTVCHRKFLHKWQINRISCQPTTVWRFTKIRYDYSEACFVHGTATGQAEPSIDHRSQHNLCIVGKQAHMLTLRHNSADNTALHYFSLIDFITIILFLLGTNDKAGSPYYLLKFCSPQAVKETNVPTKDWKYNYMNQ